MASSDYICFWFSEIESTLRNTFVFFILVVRNIPLAVIFILVLWLFILVVSAYCS